jgi:hypothetical protein
VKQATLTWERGLFNENSILAWRPSSGIPRYFTDHYSWTLGGVMLDMNVDKKLLAEQKQLLLEAIWDIDTQDKRYKLWGLVELIDHIQDEMEAAR